MSETPQSRVGVLFVCHANMCRSPLAEGVFRHLARARGMLDKLEIDSAGTHAMEGAAPHPRSCEIAKRHGLALEGSSRQLYRDDLSRFDHIVVMDRENLATIERLAAPSAFGSLDNYRAQIRLLREIGHPRTRGRELDVPDPIGRGPERYHEIYALIAAGCEALLDELSSPPQGT